MTVSPMSSSPSPEGLQEKRLRLMGKLPRNINQLTACVLSGCLTLKGSEGSLRDQLKITPPLVILGEKSSGEWTLHKSFPDLLVASTGIPITLYSGDYLLPAQMNLWCVKCEGRIC